MAITVNVQNNPNPDALLKVLLETADLLKTEYKSKLPTASGNLKNSIEFLVHYNDINQDYSITLNAEAYWYYIEHGRKPGKRPPVSAMLEFIRIKKILPRPNKDGKIPTELGLAFAMATHIGKFGLPAKHTLRDSVTPIMEIQIPKIEKAIQEKFEEDIINSFKSNGFSVQKKDNRY